MAKAIWDGLVLAESTDIVTVEGNLYVPRSSLKPEFFRPSAHPTTCARSLHLEVGGQVNQNAVCIYDDLKRGAAEIKYLVVFWKGVDVQFGHELGGRQNLFLILPIA